jgi:hypothetical protein
MKTTIVSADKLPKPKEISFQYNCREPSPASKAYKEMRETLRRKPEEFVELNSGVTLANQKYLLDGGHTYLAIQDAIKEDGVDPSKVKVKVVYMDDLSPEEMTKRSVGLNNKVTPPLRGERAIKGDWKVIQKHLSDDLEKLYEFKTNATPDHVYKVDFLVALLHGWYHTSQERCYSSKGVLVRLYTPEKYEKQLPYLNLGVKMWCTIYRDILKDRRSRDLEGMREDRETVLPDGTVAPDFLPEAYVWPVYSAFHTIIAKREGAESLAKAKGRLAELADPNRAIPASWARDKKRMLDELFKSYRANGKNPTKLGKDSVAYMRQTVALLDG